MLLWGMLMLVHRNLDLKMASVSAQENLKIQKIQTMNTEDSISTILQELTLEEKAAQLFFITPEALTNISGVTAAGGVTRECFSSYPVGGIVYFEENICSREQVSDMLSDMQSISMDRLGLPVFLATDEEGGSVCRISGNGMEGVPVIGDMLTIGNSGDTSQAYRAGKEIGSYLSELNFNVDFAPVADIFSNPENTVIGSRAFGYDAAAVSKMVPMLVKGLSDQGIKATLKHFPGHGDTSEDSHEGYACSYRTLDELRSAELLPFQAGIDAGADFVMVGHISLPNILGDYTPASLSRTMVTEILREELGFQGIIITDAMNMGAIAYNYNSGEAAVQAILAGSDMILMPEDFYSAYETVCQAVYDEKITEERLDESVERILRVKAEIK